MVCAILTREWFVKNIVALKVYNYKLKNQILQPQSEYNKHEVIVLELFNMSSDLQLHIIIILKQKKERKARERGANFLKTKFLLHVLTSLYQIPNLYQKLRSGDHPAKTEVYPKFYKSVLNMRIFISSVYGYQEKQRNKSVTSIFKTEI